MSRPSISPAYRFVMAVTTPVVRWWGRLDVTGLDQVPTDGPLLVVANHDSYWDPIAVGLAARPVRQIHALAKSSLWKTAPVGWVLDGMGQIPIDRGAGDAAALTRAIESLREGRCIGMFPEGTRSLGRTLRARSGLGRLVAAVPEAEVVCCRVTGTTDITAVPRRPAIRVRFFRPAQGGLQPGEGPADFGQRLLDEIRADAPRVPPGRKAPAT
jgi:1-acyl-sn-glycerol-3-phosphate acyltransferase